MSESTEKSTTLASELYKGSEVDATLSPVIFLHAMLCSKEVWEDIPKIVAEATKRKVYVYDAGNHGANEHSEHFSFDQNVDDLFQFMKEIKAEKAILVGHSMGAVTAIRATLKEPSKVEKLISVEMHVKLLSRESIGNIIDFVKMWKEAVEEVKPNTKPEDVTTVSVKILYTKLTEHQQLDEEKDSYEKLKFVYDKTADGYRVKYNDKAILGFLRNYDDLEKGFFKELEESKKECDVPAHFIYAGQSHYDIKSEVDSIKAYFKNAKFVEIDGKAHFIFAEKPDQFKEKLLECFEN